MFPTIKEAATSICVSRACLLEREMALTMLFRFCCDIAPFCPEPEPVPPSCPPLTCCCAGMARPAFGGPVLELRGMDATADPGGGPDMLGESQAQHLLTLLQPMPLE